MASRTWRYTVLAMMALSCLVLINSFFPDGIKQANQQKPAFNYADMLGTWGKGTYQSQVPEGQRATGDLAPKTPPDFTLPAAADLQLLDENSLYRIYWKYINMLQTLCKDVVRVGSMKDGGKEICIDEPYKPTEPCLVYSFGINNQFDFDKDVIYKFGCEVHCFDPSMKMTTRKVEDKLWFYKWGLGGKNETTLKGWRMETLDNIRRELNHTKRPIDILKIDIEGDEWNAIPQMISSGALDDVRQISMETHFGKQQWSKVLWGNRKFDEQLLGLQLLYDFGFRIFMRERNTFSVSNWPGVAGKTSTVNEISLIKV